MNVLSKKYKLFIVITLAVLVVGMTLFGIFGFNRTVDYKNGYELKVSIEQNAGDAKSILLNSTEDYFKSSDVKASDYSFQSMDDGKILVYKFSKDMKFNVENLTKYIQGKLDEANLGVKANAEYSTVIGNDYFKAGWLILALAIGLVIVFLYSLIMEKLSGAVATVCSAVVSFLAFVAVMGITRIPAFPLVEATAALAMIAAAVLSTATVARFREEHKNSNENKPNVWDVTERVMKNEVKKYIFTLIAFAVAAVAISVFFVPNLIIVGAQVLLVGLIACTVSYFGTPLVWAAIKGRKGKK